MTVSILLEDGDVEICAPGRLLFVNVEHKLSVMKSAQAIIAAPTPAAHGAETRSHAPEAGCWTSLRLVRTEDVTPAMIPPAGWVITNPASRVPARHHVCQ